MGSFPYSPFGAGSLIGRADVRPVSFAEQDDTPIAILIRYVGSQESGIVDVAATTGDFTFKHGDVGSETADTSVGSSGVLDVSLASYDTWGEVVDAINASDNWQAVLVDVVRSQSSNAAALAVTGKQCKVPEGAQINIDTTQALYATRLVAPDRLRKDIQAYDLDYAVGPARGSGNVDPAWPFRGNRALLEKVVAKSTFATGSSTFKVYRDLPANAEGAGAVTGTVWSEAGGATGTEKTFDFSNGELTVERGYRMVVAVENTTAMSASSLVGQGAMYRSLS